MDSIPRYYWRWIKASFHWPFLLADAVAGLLAMLGGLASYMDWITSKAAALVAIFVPLGILILGVLAQFIRAPYSMHCEDEKNAEKARQAEANRAEQAERKAQEAHDADRRALELAKAELRELAGELESKIDDALVERRMREALEDAKERVGRLTTSSLYEEFAQICGDFNKEGKEWGNFRKNLETYRNSDKGRSMREKILRPCIQWLEEKGGSLEWTELKPSYRRNQRP